MTPAKRSRLLVLLVLLSALAPAAPASAAEPAPADPASIDPYSHVVEITLPADPRSSFSDSYTACRSGCSRMHQAADLMGQRMWPLFAATDGHVCRIDEGEEDSYGRHLTICGNDGNRYRYLHLNNDTPGTDDGAAGLEHVYAPGIRRGVRVVAGQLVAYMGDSGNAEGTPPHLHFDIFVPGVVNPWGEERINPYPSLRAAVAAGRLGDPALLPSEPTQRLAGTNRIATAVAVSQAAFERADTVVLAASEVPHDALVAGPLAAVNDGPVLLTTTPQLAEDTFAELIRLAPREVVLVGQASALRDEVAARLPAVTLEAIDGGGPTRTSVAVAERIWQQTGATAPTGGDYQPAAQAPGTPSTAASHGPTLMVSLHPDRSDSVPLHESALSGDRLYVWLDGVRPRDVASVSYRLDGEHVNTERHWHYDLGGGDGQDSRGVRMPEVGEHVATARIRFDDGDTRRVSAHFHVGDGPGDDSRSEDDLLWRPQRDKVAIVAKASDPVPSRTWPDALAASWYGAARQVPVLLTAHDHLPQQVADVLADADEVVVAGGPRAIGDGQLDQLAAGSGAPQVRRVAGTDRYATAAAIAAELEQRDLADPATVHVATGANWPDAVAAAPAIATRGDVLLLVDPAGSSPTARVSLTDRARDIDEVVALGGPSAVSSDVLRRASQWAV